MRKIKLLIPVVIALFCVGLILALPKAGQAAPIPRTQLDSVIQQGEPISGFYLGPAISFDEYSLGREVCSPGGSWYQIVTGQFELPEENYAIGGLFELEGGWFWKAEDGTSYYYAINTAASAPSLGVGATGKYAWPRRIAFMNSAIAIPDILPSTDYEEIFEEVAPDILDLWQTEPTEEDGRINNSGVGGDGEGPGGTVYFKYTVNWKTPNCLTGGSPPSFYITIRPVYYGLPPDCVEVGITDVGAAAEYNIVVTDETGEISDIATTTVGTVYRLETANGPWYSATSPPGAEHYDIQIADQRSGDGWFWRSLEYYQTLHPITTTIYSGTEPLTETFELEDWICPDVDGGYTTIYFQAITNTLRARVADMPGNFDTNSGTMGYILTPVRFGDSGNPSSPLLPAGGCSGEGWGVKDVWYSFSAPADSEAGVSWGSASVPGGPIQMGQYYMLETTQPWYEFGGSSEQWDAENAHEAGDLYTTPDFPDAHCTEARSDGGYRVFFQAGASPYSLRVHDVDSNWANNTGLAEYTVWNATRYEAPPGKACMGKYKRGALLATFDVAAFNSPNGTLISPLNETITGSIGFPFDGFNPGDFYLVRVQIDDEWVGVPGDSLNYWEDYNVAIDPSDPQYDFVVQSAQVEITDDGGGTWIDLADYGCGGVYDPAFFDGAEETFIQAGEGEYRIRVDNQDELWIDQLGGAVIEIYSATNYDFKDDENCADRFDLGDTLAFGIVDAEIREVDLVPPYGVLTPERFYALEVIAGSWNLAGSETPYHDLWMNVDPDTWDPSYADISTATLAAISETMTVSIPSQLLAHGQCCKTMMGRSA